MTNDIEIAMKMVKIAAAMEDDRSEANTIITSITALGLPQEMIDEVVNQANERFTNGTAKYVELIRQLSPLGKIKLAAAMHEAE